MAAITVTVRLSAESAAFIRKCIGDANPVELDEFFEAAIAALAASILELDKVMTGDEFRSLRNH